MAGGRISCDFTAYRLGWNGTFWDTLCRLPEILGLRMFLRNPGHSRNVINLLFILPPPVLGHGGWSGSLFSRSSGCVSSAESLSLSGPIS